MQGLINLICNNAFIYNKPDTAYYKLALDLQSKAYSLSVILEKSMKFIDSDVFEPDLLVQKLLMAV